MIVGNLMSRLICEVCIGVLRILYFQGYRTLSILLPGIQYLFTFRDVEYLGNVIMGILASV